MVIMLRITAVGAGAVDYLLRGSGCCAEQDSVTDLELAPEHERGHERGAARYFGAAVESGEPAGRWGGRGLGGMFGIQDGARASEDSVRSVFGKLEDPRTGESLGQAPRKYRTTEERVEAALAAAGPEMTPEQRRQLEVAAAADGRRAVAYYDLTFSPSKSVSVYYAALLAAGDVEGAAAVAAAHDRAVEQAMAYAEQHVGYTRAGYHGRTADGRSVGRYEAGEGLVWTAWRHSTNRESEPQLHTHVAVLNRIRTVSDGVVRALDGRGFRPVKEAIATAYERSLEEELVATRGVVMADRPDGRGREIVGVDPELCAEASTRRAQTLAKAEELTAQYVARNGREPDAAARKAILHDAAMATRKPKEGVAGPAAVAAWAGQDDRPTRLLATLEAVADAAEAAASGQDPDRVAGLRLDPTVAEQRRALLAAAVADVQHAYAAWTVGNLVAAIDRRIGPLPVEARGDARPAYLEALAAEALAPGNTYGVVLLTAPDPVTVPEELRRPQDGRSIFRPHCDERYATLAQLATEQGLVVSARQLTAPALAGPEVELLRVELAAAGLAADQVDAVVGIVGSGRAGDVLIGPAGTGKSHTVAALSQVWTDRLGGRVLGLATTEIATQNLVADGVAAMNTARFLALYGEGQDGQPPRQRVGRGDLFVVDEAGMSATGELAPIADIVAAGGGKLVYTGDHGQLTSIGAGGLLALLAHDNGAYELAEVHRFTHDWEKEASLRLRAGDSTVIPEYEDRGRLHGGTLEQMQAAAMRAWLADTIDGKDALLIVGTNEQAAELSRDIRAQLIRYGQVSPTPVTELGQLAGWAKVSVGDRVQARQVDRNIRVDDGQLVANRAVYTVLGLDADGALRVRGADGGIAHLPRSYVDQHLTLAYASTVYAAQGRTVDTCHALLDEAAAREAAYVALSRGREANYAYLVAAREPDAHQAERLAATAAERLAGALGNVEARPSATVEQRIGARDGTSLAWIGTQWDEVSHDCARDRYSAHLAGLLGTDAAAALAAEAGWPRLVRAIREAELAGHDPGPLLATTVAARSLGDADQVSDVLRWRVRHFAGDRIPEQQVAVGDWTALAPPVDGPVGQFVHELAVLAQDRQVELGQTALDAPPEWAITELGPPRTYEQLTARVDTGEAVPVEEIDAVAAARTLWAQRAGAVAAYRELRGIPDEQTSIGAAPSREQEFHRRMWTQAVAALGHDRDSGAVDYRTLPDLDLYAVREQWAREQAWAPPYVAEEMRAAYQAAREYGDDAALAGAQLAVLEPDDQAWEQTAAQLQRSHHLAELNLERARQLEDLQHSRGGWYAATEDARVADDHARVELERRGLPSQRHELDRGEQLDLFDPAATRLPTARDVDRNIEDVRIDVDRTADRGRDGDLASDRATAVHRRDELDRGGPDDAELGRQVEEHARRREPAQPLQQAVDTEPAAEQLPLLRVERQLVDEVAAQPLRATPEPDMGGERDREAAASAERERQEQARITLAEARRQAEAADVQRQAREAEHTARAAMERLDASIQAARNAVAALRAADVQAEADRMERGEAERREQLNRWYDQDRAAEIDHGYDDGPSLGRDY